MSFLKAALVVAFGFAVQVASHGHVIWVECGGKRVQAFNPYPYEWKTTPTCSWRDHEIVNHAFIGPSEYRTTDINCHIGATPADLYVDVVAGETCTVQWTEWPESHHGPVLTYLGNCNGDCEKVDLDDVQWNKISAVGQTAVGKTNSDAGVWAADLLRAAGHQAKITIPKTIKAGNYLARHEIIALMGAVNVGKAQNYPNCINFRVSGDGTDPLASGTKGIDLYTPTDPGIKVSIYGTKLKYQIPGPPMYVGAVNGTSDDTPDGTSTPTSAATSAATLAATSSASSAPPSAATSADVPPPKKAIAYAQVAPDTPTASPHYVSANASVIPSFTPSATGVQPSHSSQPTGIMPGYQPKVYKSTDSDSDVPKDDGKKSYTSSGGDTTPKSGDDTTPKVDDKVSRTTKPTESTSKTADNTADKDVKIPDNASASQLLDIIDRCVSSLRKLMPVRRRHARDVTV